MLDNEAIISEVQYLPGRHGCRCGRYKCEGVSALPGEISDTPGSVGVSSSRGDKTGSEKSAEVILSASWRRRTELKLTGEDLLLC
jgi:hypothetical protein